MIEAEAEARRKYPPNCERCVYLPVIGLFRCLRCAVLAMTEPKPTRAQATVSENLAGEMAEALMTAASDLAASDLRDASVSILADRVAGGGGLATPDGIVRLSVDDVARICAKVAETVTVCRECGHRVASAFGRWWHDLTYGEYPRPVHAPIPVRRYPPT
jgi:hypothetical protein